MCKESSVHGARPAVTRAASDRCGEEAAGPRTSTAGPYGCPSRALNVSVLADTGEQSRCQDPSQGLIGEVLLRSKAVCSGSTRSEMEKVLGRLAVGRVREGFLFEPESEGPSCGTFGVFTSRR